MTERERPQEGPQRRGSPTLGEHPVHPAVAQQVHAVDGVRPATIPATKAATLIAGFDPGEPGTRTWAAARSCRPARSARVMTGMSPAHDTRFGSSKAAETLWQDRIYRMSFFLVLWNSRQVPSSQVRRTFVRHDPLKTPPSPVDRG